MDFDGLNKEQVERYEKLRKILEKEQNRPYSLKEAYEIGQDLMEFYTILARGRKITLGTPEELKQYNRQANKRLKKLKEQELEDDKSIS